MDRWRKKRRWFPKLVMLSPGFFVRVLNPGINKFSQVNRTQKAVQVDGKGKAIQTTNPFKVVK